VPRGEIILDQQTGRIWFFVTIAFARHPRAALASEFFIPSTVGMVLADPPYAKANWTFLIHQSRL
jgi:hypothetical protein